MSFASPLPPSPSPPWKPTLAAVLGNVIHDPEHPVRIALRTYALCLSASLGPALIPLVYALSLRPKTFTARARAFWRVLLRELRPTAFASAITAAVGGGVALQRVWDLLGRRYAPVHHINSRLASFQRAFLANAAASTLAVTLLRRKKVGTNSSTLDLTLLFFARALDASVQALLIRKARSTATRDNSDKRRQVVAEEWRNKIASHLDALVFWASGARIMWVWFYEPQSLPPSFEKWISSVAHVDRRLLDLLRAIRQGTWSYVRGTSKKNDLVNLALELGHPSSWTDPALLPAYGGDVANEAWKRLGIRGRSGVGGLPCDLVHCGYGAKFGLGNSCVANAGIRAIYGFAEALVMYLPIHFLPILLFKPRLLLRPHRVLHVLLSTMRSATFLSTFVSSFWFSVCVARTLVFPRLFPMISHDVWDGPYAGPLLGSLLGAASIWIENPKRRGEIALFALPKALGTFIPERWLHSRRPALQFAEYLTFILSLASLLTFSAHQPESLRGLLRWTSTLVMKGPNFGPWKKREIVTRPATPVDSTGPDYHGN